MAGSHLSLYLTEPCLEKVQFQEKVIHLFIMWIVFVLSTFASALINFFCLILEPQYELLNIKFTLVVQANLSFIYCMQAPNTF